MPLTVNTPIRAESVISANAMAAFLLSKNSTPRINCTPLELAELFIAEGRTLNIRADIAWCQSIHETGWFKYGGQVLPDQNNYAGIGATNNSPVGKGAWFETPEIGVRAQIQHLFAYACKDALPVGVVNVDPRFNLVSRGVAPTWERLNGRWAVPGTTYAQSIIALYNQLETFAATYAAEPPLEIKGENKLKVMLDAGHAGKYNRSPANSTYYESEAMWKFHNYLKAELQTYGCTVGVTRPDINTDREVYDRGYAAKGYDVFMSLHSNAVGNGVNESVDYPVVFVPLNKGSDVIGNKLAVEIQKIMGTTQAGRIATRAGSSGADYYGVIRGAVAASVPTVLLVEHSFHTQTRATNWLLIDANLKALAVAEAAILAEHFGLKKTSGGTEVPAPTELYRVRKSWADTASQIGAYGDLNNAKKAADGNAAAGYKVFNSAGQEVYSPTIEQLIPEPNPIPEIELPEEEPGTIENGYPGTGDNPSSWAKEATNWAKRIGLFAGDGNGNFDWQGNLTREQAAMLFKTFADLIEADI